MVVLGVLVVLAYDVGALDGAEVVVGTLVVVKMPVGIAPAPMTRVSVVNLLGKHIDPEYPC